MFRKSRSAYCCLSLKPVDHNRYVVNDSQQMLTKTILKYQVSMLRLILGVHQLNIKL